MGWHSLAALSGQTPSSADVLPSRTSVTAGSALLARGFLRAQRGRGPGASPAAVFALMKARRECEASSVRPAHSCGRTVSKDTEIPGICRQISKMYPGVREAVSHSCRALMSARFLAAHIHKAAGGQGPTGRHVKAAWKFPDIKFDGVSLEPPSLSRFTVC